MKIILIWWHKRRARQIDDQITLMQGSADCGDDLLEYMSPRYCGLKAAFQREVEWLREHDPEFPK